MPADSGKLRRIRRWVEENKRQDADKPRSINEPNQDAVVVTGLAGYFPGCMDVAAFFRHIDRDEPLIGRIDSERVNLITRGCVEQRTFLGAQSGGFIPDISSFDAELFGILPMEAEEMDPRERLLLMSVWRTLEDAGVDPGSLRKSATGVFIGCESNEYAQLMGRAGFVPSSGLSQADSMLANRISYQFDLAGPSEIVNATCAGFAVALHRAFAAIRSGSIDRAIVGAANVILLPEPFRILQAAGQLTSGFTVKSFGKESSGFLRAEGAGTILIERLRDAESAGRAIYARIRNVSVNFNGQGGVSMAAPNVEAHAELIKACYRGSGIDPRRVSYFEAQGMGLPVADIAEWSAVNRALSELCAEKGLAFEPGFCRVSTLKPLIGHMHSASSLGAFLRIIRSFQTGKIHGISGFGEPSEFCDTEGAPCRFATRAESWETAGEPRLAALHSFGSGGNNAHVLLEECMGEQRARADRQDNLKGKAFDLKHIWFPLAAGRILEPAEDNQGRVLVELLEALGRANAPRAVDSPFTELGVDSLSVRTLAARLESRFNVSVRTSDVFSHSTPRRLANYVASNLTQVADETPSASPVRRAHEADDDIAIIGMTLRVAGADNHDSFWHLLKEGKCAIDSLPTVRLKSDGHDTADIRGGFLSSIDTFDPLFFGIAPRECETMDPRHRLLLEGAWSAIEDAGYNPESWRGAEHGIFLGIEESDYPVSGESPITSVHGGTAPARIGYFLDTKGPLLAISTACSSSLVAIHYAARSILNGESDCALAGGCNIICQPERTHAALSRMGNMVSPDGVCYAFDRRANGMVMGEGVGLVVLKRLSQARRDGDSVYAVIKASGINYDGRTNGLTAPSGERQRELYEKVRHNCGIRPEQISYVVTHGTGTTLGDPIECNALMDAFGRNLLPDPWCALTSPKTNIGHTQAASGVVNLIAAALALHHRAIPPSLNYEESNPDIRFEGSPFYVNTSLKNWDAAERYAAVSSFGHTGTNAHVLLAAAGVPEPGQRGADGPSVVVLSAKTEGALRESAARLLLHPAGWLQDLAWTLQDGRTAMEVRLGFVARSWDDMRTKLNAFLDGAADPREVFFSATPFGSGEPREAIGAWIDQRRYADLAKVWVEGAAVDWSVLHGQTLARRVHLPTYPFEKEHYWLNTASGVPVNAEIETANPPTHEILIFEETWQPAPLIRASNPPLGNSVCVLYESAAQREIALGFTQLTPETRLELVKAGNAEAMEKAFRAIRKESGNPDILFDLRAVASPETLENPFAAAQLIQSLAVASLKPKRVLIGCAFGTELEKCHVDAWVAFERSLRAVLPDTRFAIVGVSAAASPGEIAERLHDEWHSTPSASILYERGQRLTPCIRPAILEPADCPLRQGGVYLIVGGAGELGLLLAEHLAAKYRANLVLTGRSGLAPKKRSRLMNLIRKGCGAMYLEANVCDADAMNRAVQTAKERFGAIDGVIHAAGIESAGTVFEKSEDEFRRVTGPKMEGVVILDRVLANEPLDFLAYFSSSAACVGDFGACDYAIGNRFQTAFARYRNELVARGARMGKTVVVNWPVWKHGGMARDKADQTEFYLKTSGQRALETAEGMELFERLLSARGTQYLVMAGQRSRLLQYVSLNRGSEAKTPGSSVAQGPGRKPEHGGFSVEECLRQDVSDVVGSILKIPRERLRADRNLGDIGFDSMSLAELALGLTKHFGIEITPAIFFGHSTIGRICRFYMAEHGEAIQLFYSDSTPLLQEPLERVAEPAVPVPEPQPPVTMEEPIAIIGMSGRFPCARDVNAMWEIQAQGRDAVEEVPSDRFDWRDYYGDPATNRKKTNGKWGGFVPGVAEFDPLFFEISPRDAEAMDPRQRLLLQEAWNALEDAGYGPRQIGDGKVGVFVGAEEGDYAFLGGDGAIASNHNGILASRISYFLDLHGPAMAINTACSSGLVAAHQACQSLRAGECTTAIAAGVNLILTPAALVAMAQSGMLSKDGKCFVFDKRANGMVPGEAVVAMVLKPLSKAEADGDPIHAVIRASAVNYDGRTNGIAAPSGVAQTELLRDVYSRPGLSAADVDYVVTHGTGTKLGDPVEINALYDVFREAGARPASCALTSTKSNFGHTFAASGLLSAVSLVKAFESNLIPASLHCENENDYIKWGESPFFVNKHSRPWPRNPQRSRRGAVSAFGMSGTNAHMVFEEYAETVSPHRVQLPHYLLVLSARTPRALNERVNATADALKNAFGVREELGRVSCTLLDGRHHFRCRMALVVQDLDDAVTGLEAFVAGKQRTVLFHGSVPLEFEGRKVIRRHAAELLRQCGECGAAAADYRDALLTLADYYCQGYDPEWSLLFGVHPPSRIHLPTYPFEREHYWVGQSPSLRPVAGRGDSVSWLHPLVHRNTSTFARQQFTSTFTGSEPFLADHVVNGRKILPAAGVLEMIRAAMERSADAAALDSGFELRNVVWVRPLVVPDEGLDVVVGIEPTNEGYRFECRAGSGERDSEAAIHATGLVFLHASTAPDGQNLDGLKERIGRKRISADECYASFESCGVNYGPFYRCLRDLVLGDGESLARIDLTGIPEGSGSFGLHPGALDTAFQATAGLQGQEGISAAPRVPFALESMTMFRAMPTCGWAWARRSPAHSERMEGSAAGNEIGKLDISLYDEAGNPVVWFRGFSTREFVAGNPPTPSLSRTLTGSEFFVKDHGGLLPGVVSLEWAQAAAAEATHQSVVGLRQVVWSHPIHVNGVPREVITSVRTEGDALAWRVSAGEVVHAQGRIVTVQHPATPPEVCALDLNQVQERCGVTIARDDCHRLLQADLGPGLRSIVSFRHNGIEAIASLELPAVARAQKGDYRLHPSMMNGAVQAANLLSVVQHPDRRPQVPFCLESLWIHGEIPEKAVAYVTGPRPDASGVDGGYDILITDRQGIPKVSIHGYHGLSTEHKDAEGVLYAVPCWLPKPIDGMERAGAGERDQAPPLFILDSDATGWKRSIEDRWPAARFVILPRVATHDSVLSGFLEVFENLRECVSIGSGDFRPIVLAAPDVAYSPIHNAIAGLFRSARQEHPKLIAKILRLPEVATEALNSRWIHVIGEEIGRRFADDPEVRYDGAGDRFVASIEEIKADKATPELPISPGDVIWVTGGAGGVGFEFARYLAQTRKARVILSSRSSLSSGKQRQLDAPGESGAPARYVRCDVSDVEDVKRVVDSILAVEGRLNGIVHCAGVVEDAWLIRKTNDQVRRVLRPKIAGAFALDKATRGVPLDFLVFFSSLTGAFGNPGQADYAAANAFLDGFAMERNRAVSRGDRSGRTISIAWPLWRDGGMGLDESHTELLRQKSGMTPMSTNAGMGAFARCLQSGFDHVLVLHGDIQAMRSRLLAGEAATLPDTKLSAISFGSLLRILTAMVAEQQKIPVEKIEPEAKLPQYGFDSLGFTEFATRLNRRFDLDLMPTLFFEKSSLNALTQHLLDRYPEKLSSRLDASPANRIPLNAASARRPAVSSRFVRESEPGPGLEFDPIAIVGMSGRFPGVNDVDAFWRLIEDNRDMVSEVPPDRWDWRAIYGDASEERGKTKVRSAGFMSGVDRFDPAFFGISPREAIALDPQLRLLMETVWLTIEDAGYRAGDLAGRRIGVFMGVSTSDYKEAWLRHAASGKAMDGPPLVSHFGIANRISYTFDLRGPSEPVDTACSSSLIAIHRAIEAMRMGHCESALVGGVNAILTPDLMIEASRAGMLSDDGRCRTFDKRANGYGRGEGVAALMLKPLNKALDDGDHVYCVIRGSAENHGGRAASPTAPNAAAQHALLVEAYTRAGVDPGSVGYIEAHGTGTELGDAVEIDGLKAAFAELYEKRGGVVVEQHCALGSVKTNIGHLEAAAGMAGVVKAIQMLRHRKIPGNPHLQNPNPYLRLEGTPFYLASRTEDWKSRIDEAGQSLPLRAGVSSFGIGGSNAHVILEGFEDRLPSQETSRDSAGTETIVLSAKNAASLKGGASRLLEFFRTPPDGHLPALRDVAWTLQNGREAMQERMGFVASSVAEVIEKLTLFVLKDGLAVTGIHRGIRAHRTTEIRPQVASDRPEGPERLLAAWVNGADVHWDEEHGSPRPRRVRLPGYVFDRKRFWFGEEQKELRLAVAAAAGAGSVRPVVSLREIGPPPPEASLSAAESSVADSGSPKRASSVHTSADSIADVLAGMLAEVLYMSSEDISRDAAFIDLGLDSVIGVEWIKLVNRHFGIKLSATKIYDHPDVSAFARYLSDSLGPAPAVAPPASLDEALEQVQRGSLTVEEAETLIANLGLAGQ